MSGSEMTLAELAPGKTATVLALEGGHGFVGRMVALGFTPGSTLHMVRNPGVGPVIVRLLDTQIALGRGEAQRVKVRA